MDVKSDIQDFFRDQTIFITGGTGFVGKVVIEKLLRACYDLKMIYVLVRAKKTQSSGERFQKLFDMACFERVKELRPNFREKIQMIQGDCSEPLLGLSSQVREILKKEVTVIISAAADVRFDQDLRQGVNNNVRNVKETLDLAKEVLNLKAMIYVSTAFSNPDHARISEKFYKPLISAENLLHLVEALDNKMLKVLEQSILKKWPNVYTFTKSVAEDLIKREGKGLPLAIIRPAIVISSIEEPVAGWVDNLYGINGQTTGILLGAIRSIYYIKKYPAHLVPCDFLANFLLATTWNLSNQNRSLENPIQIYSCVPDDCIINSDVAVYVEKSKWLYPMGNMFYFPSCSYTQCYYYHKLRLFIFHLLLPLIVDGVLICLNRKPVATKFYGKINKFLELTHYFRTTLFQFENTNLKHLWQQMSEKDKEMFNFDFSGIDWEPYMVESVKWSQHFVFKQTLGDLPKRKRRLMIFAFAHYAVTALIAFLAIHLLYTLFL
ncbi:fatty acyl-CoA reductase wat-like [Tribolium castaneum]|nr:PREDICTED: putative fatty acyl-CoA reductase CG5065 [Tribolium castaneum]|eukprot:XP_008195701.1 PREDICTED: putative fatty acyl-CoA reductase CG5065 [Tribolium castaneum]